MSQVKHLFPQKPAVCAKILPEKYGTEDFTEICSDIYVNVSNRSCTTVCHLSHIVIAQFYPHAKYR